MTIRLSNDCADKTKQLEGGKAVDRYYIVIKNLVRFSLAGVYLMASPSIRQVLCVMMKAREKTGLAVIDSSSSVTVARYARSTCAINLQKIFELLGKAWTLPHAPDMSAHLGVSFLDICIRLHLNDVSIINLHLLTSLVYNRHASQVIFQVLQKYWMSCVNRGEPWSSEYRRLESARWLPMCLEMLLACDELRIPALFAIRVWHISLTLCYRTIMCILATRRSMASLLLLLDTFTNRKIFLKTCDFCPRRWPTLAGSLLVPSGPSSSCKRML